MNFRNLLPFWAFFSIFYLNVMAAAPVITSVSPAVGPVAGGTFVTITGTGFTGTTAVTFGDTPATAFIVNSDTSAFAFSPVHIPQVVNIFFTAPSGTSPANDTSFFTFQGDWTVYVSNREDDTVSVINAATDTVFATLTVGVSPGTIDLLPDGSKAFVASDVLTVLDVATNTVENAIVITPFAIRAMVITPDGSKNYIADEVLNLVSVVDNVTQMEISTIPVGGRPFNIAITPDGTKVYVANFDDDNISVISTASNTVIATVTVGDAPVVLTAIPDGTKVYVGNGGATNVSVISTSTNTVIATITVGSNPTALAVTPDGTEVLVANAVTSNVSVISTASDTVVATVTVGATPSIINITPDGTQAYVVNENDDNVSVIDLASNTVVATVTVGSDPEAQLMAPDGKKVYVVSFNDNNVTVIDTETNTFSSTITVGSEPDAIGITPDQAPLAQFTIMAQNAGLPTTFNASQSVSPTGTIANYFWDFGDGSPSVNTANPVITHVYQAPGSYTVTLIVTNTAGTSLTQILNFSSSSPDFINSSSPTTNNNGGPTAMRIHDLVIGVAPPSNFKGCVKKNKFLNKTEYLLNATFLGSPTAGVIFYRVYQNGSVILEIPARSTSLTVCVASKNAANDIYMAAVLTGNIESVRVPVTVIGSCCSH